MWQAVHRKSTAPMLGPLPRLTPAEKISAVLQCHSRQLNLPVLPCSNFTAVCFISVEACGLMMEMQLSMPLFVLIWLQQSCRHGNLIFMDRIMEQFMELQFPEIKLPSPEPLER